MVYVKVTLEAENKKWLRMENDTASKYELHKNWSSSLNTDKIEFKYMNHFNR